jgi:hypothetical protein
MNRSISLLTLFFSLSAIGQVRIDGSQAQNKNSRVQPGRVESLATINSRLSNFEASSAEKNRVLPKSLLESLQNSIATPKGTHLISGGQDGNGGNMLLCLNPNGTLKSKELLDYYESRVIRGITPSLGDPSLHYLEKIEMVLKRIQHLSPRRFRSYLEEARSFESQSVFLPATDLTTLPDSQHPVVPKNCTVVQTVIQRTPVFPEDKRYIVNKDIWDILDNDDKAGLVLHEAILREAALMAPILAAYGVIPESQQVLRDSGRVRYINSLISSERLINKNPQEWAELAAKAHLSPVVELFGGLFSNSNQVDNGTIRFGTEPRETKMPNGYPFGERDEYWGIQLPTQTPVGPIYCRRGIRVDNSSKKLVSCREPHDFYKLEYSKYYKFPLNGGDFHYNHNTIIHFYGSGIVKSACIANGNWTILNPDGSKINIKNNSIWSDCGRVRWNEQGYFVSFELVEGHNIYE